MPDPTDLRVQLEALAQDWAIEATAPLTSPTGKLAFARCAKELRLVLNQSEDAPTRPYATSEGA